MIFVELTESKCEGAISVNDLIDDVYLYDQDNYLLRGRNSGRQFQLGDLLIVKVIRTDLRSRTIDFDLVEQL